jgi:hypothetical protein
MHGSALSRRGFAGLLGLAALSLSALAGVGCGPPGIVIRQGAPNPFVGKSEFVVEAVAYPGLQVGDKTEAAYLSDKKPEQQQSFEADKTETAKNLLESLTVEAGKRGIRITPSSGTPGMFNIRPVVTFFEPGNFNGFVNIATVLKATMQILDAQGQVIDEVQFQATVGASLVNPSSGGRMHSAGKILGTDMARYLTFRAAAGK